MKQNFYICVICMLIKLFKLQFSSFNVPFKKILIFYRQMSEIKTWVFRGEANQRLKETDFAGEINIMFMWLFFFFKLTKPFCVNAGQGELLAGLRVMCPCQVTRNQQSHQCVDCSWVSFLKAAQIPALHSPRLWPSLPYKGCSSSAILSLHHKWRAERPKWAVPCKEHV